MNFADQQSRNIAAKGTEYQEGARPYPETASAPVEGTFMARAKVVSGSVAAGYVCAVFDGAGSYTNYQGPQSVDANLRTWPEGESLSVDQQVMLVWFGNSTFPVIIA